MKKPVVDYTKLRFSNISSKEYRHLLLLLGWVAYLIMYVVTERIPVSSCHDVHSVVDDIVPFNEYFAIFYVSWYLFMVASILHFMLYDIKSFVRAEKLIVGMQIVAVITYLVWPSVQNLRPDHFEHDNICTQMMGFLYKIDTPTGVCPSLHVGYTLAVLSAWLFTSKDVKTWKKILLSVWSFMICLSVLFVKQHSFTDVWAAVVMYIFLELVLNGRNIKLGKRRLGDRRDGELLRDIDSMHYIMPLMYPNRCDNEAYMKLTVDISKTEEYIKAFNEAHPENRIAIWDIVIAAALKTIRVRTQMNRFIANQTMYQRNNVTAAFTVKKDFRDDGDETLARIVAEDDDTLESISRKVRQQIALCKTRNDESTEAMNFIMKLPGKHLIGAIARFLDRHGWMPQSVIATDPYQCSVVLTNLGSLGMNIGYHHLMNWGTNSVFIIMGSKQFRPHFDQNGNITMKRELDLAFTIDERISDGFYYGRSLRFMKKLVENPELMEKPLSENIE
jgi:hypothetical protein